LIQEFVSDDLSNWYVRLNRKRFWKPSSKQSGMNLDKEAAYQTLYNCLSTIAKLSSPIAPFYMDRLYIDLNQVTGMDKKLSVHLTDFPNSDKSMIDKDLEDKMQLAQNISSLVHSIRKNEKIKVRQPLSKVLIPIRDQKFKEQIQAVEGIILSEVNTKGIEFIDDESAIILKKAKPNFRKLGKEYGAKLKELSNVIGDFSAEDISVLEKEKKITVDLLGETINLTLEDVEIVSEDIPGWSVANDGKLTVALDITLTDELRREGLARDLVNRVQNLRKEMGLEVQDKITILLEKNKEIFNQAIEIHRDYICGETQALSMKLIEKLDDPTILEIDKLKVKIKINA